MVFPKHIDNQTVDGAQMNLDALYQICPSCFTEAQGDDGELKHVVDWNKLRALLGDNATEDAPEVYDFTWVGKRAAQREAMAPIRKTLRPCPEESVNWDTTQNLYIEGDNLEVLKLLQNSYMGKVKMIYIDPPYNTGNDFVYHDDFHRTQREEDEEAGVFNEKGERMVKNTESNGKFHSDWCSMIYSRLMVARSLLKDDGVIFMSIDDNEDDNLRKICNEIFGQSNLVGVFVWTKKKKGSHLSKTFRSMTEYVLCYAKNVELIELFGEDAYSDKWQPIVKKTNAVKVLTFPANLIETSLPGPLYTSGIYAKDTTPIEFLDNIIIRNGRIENGFRVSGPFVWTQTKLEEEISAGTKFSLSNKFGFNVFRSDQLDKVKRPSSIIDSKVSVGTNEDASSEVEQLFGKERIMDYPKPSSLLRYLINTLAYYDKNMIVLDFFSGSATTAHAMIQLNAQDEGKRKFIMVQLPEETPKDSEAYKAGYKNICEIGKERIRRAGKKIKEENPEAKDLDIGFRVFKCDDSNFKDVAFAPKDYTQESLDLFVDNIKEDRTDLDLLFDCMLRWGVTLDLPMTKKKVGGCTIHNVNEGALVACFDGVVTEAVIDAIAEMYPAKVVFRDSSFEEAAQKMNIFELFKQKCGWDEQEVRNNIRVI